MNGSVNHSYADYDSGPYQFPALPVYRSGEVTQETGVFTVVHPRETKSLEVIILRGTTLPYCPDCNHALAFCLERAAAYIHEDADFVPQKRIRRNRKRQKALLRDAA
ncbi:MAG TPA: hypothetical protein VK699_18305 [Terriglobales bacterium]|jgi:hypothetical protein|nr:hypothetical protein [Terriglobales bacterium]